MAPEKSVAESGVREKRGLAIARKYFRQIAESWREGGRYTVPSEDGQKRYSVVLLGSERCECRDNQFGHVCKHIVAATVVHAKTRVCAGCNSRVLPRELVEVPEGHLTFFEGDLVCEECARNYGVV